MSDIVNKIGTFEELLGEGVSTKFLYDHLPNWFINQQFNAVFAKVMKGKRFTAASAENLFRVKYPDGFTPVDGSPKIMAVEYRDADWDKLAKLWSGGPVMSRNKIDEAVAIPAAKRHKINVGLHEIGRVYHKSIPLSDIFDILKSNGVMPVQEDGSEWSGLLSGREGKAHIDLKAMGENAQDFKSVLVLTWHKMESGRYEVVAYLS